MEVEKIKKCKICNKLFNPKSSNLTKCSECVNKEYIQKVKEINSNIIPIEQYKNAKTKIMHRCVKHNTEWSVLPTSILAGCGCEKCKKEKLSTTNDNYIKRLKEINKNIISIEKYINNATKITHKCLVDNYVWKVRPSDILGGHGCPKCSGVKRRTHDEYVEELMSINPNIEVLEQYINKDTAIKHKCLIDSYEWYPIPNNLLRGAKCPRCSRVERYTTEEFKSRLKLINSDVEILEEYINSSTPIKAKCLIDEYIWSVRPGDLLSGYGCPKCGRLSMALNQEIEYKEFIARLEEVHKGKIIHVGNYVNLKTTTEFKCMVDNYTWLGLPSNVIHNGTGCPKCANNMKYTTKKFIEFISVINPEVEVLGKYTGKENKIKCRCKVDNHIWYPKAGNLKNKKSNCPICSKKIAVEAISLSKEKFISRIFEINPNLELIGDFYTVRKKVLINCKECNHIWKANPRDLLYSKSGCPKCAAKQVESRLANLSKELACEIFGKKSENEYKKCVNPRTGYILPYDIFIEYNNKKYLIEIHGPQHEKYIPYFHRNGISDYEYQVWKDNYKRNWAVTNGYTYKFFWVEYNSIEDIENYYKSLLQEIIKK